MKLRIAVVALVLAGSIAAQTPDELRTMMDQNRAFALRDAVERQGISSPIFYRGVVEASQNEIVPARRDLEQVIRDNPHSKEASDAREALANMESRNGQYREALHWAEDAVAVTGSEDAKNELPAFRAFAAAGDIKVVQLKSSTVDCKEGLPVVIGGKTVTYGFDTGGAQSVMGKSDAKMLGLVLQHAGTKLRESSGTAIPGFDVAIAKDLLIGGLHLRNVPFIVLDDTGEPFVHIPVGQRGAIGLPVVMAMRAIRWQPALGKCEFGPGVGEKETSLRNLLFDGMTPIVRLGVDGKTLTFSLDTGARDSDLNEGFAKTLPELVRSGKKETRPITGYGGTDNYDSVLLGPVTFRVGNLDVTLSSPHVFPSHSLGKFDGNLGNDILNQAKTVTLDFDAMDLRLE